MLAESRPSIPGVRIELDGSVQGIGFRPWVYSLARSAAIRGRVWNHSTGVTIEAFGDQDALHAFMAQLAHPPMPAAYIRELRYSPIEHDSLDSFEIVASRAGELRRPSIPPDLGMCDECRRELLDVTDRRYAYAFINCTRCGPRYTISVDVPYDRAHTTMAAFPMCDACRSEYQDPGDRRFHAQPNACPECGPQVRLRGSNGARSPATRLPAAALLLEGGIVGVKGLGGYHLACDATNADAMARCAPASSGTKSRSPSWCRACRRRNTWRTSVPRTASCSCAATRPIVLLMRRRQ